MMLPATPLTFLLNWLPADPGTPVAAAWP